MKGFLGRRKRSLSLAARYQYQYPKYSIFNIQYSKCHSFLILYLPSVCQKPLSPIRACLGFLFPYSLSSWRFQPSPQGAFPWLFPPHLQSQGKLKRPGDEVVAISYSLEPRANNLYLIGTRSFAFWSIPACLCISKAMLDIIYIAP